MRESPEEKEKKMAANYAAIFTTQQQGRYTSGGNPKAEAQTREEKKNANLK